METAFVLNTLMKEIFVIHIRMDEKIIIQVDVYKRQRYECLRIRCGLKYVLKVGQEKIKLCMAKMTGSTDHLIIRIKLFLSYYNPVSYTHLDVYKRQVVGGNGIIYSKV